MLEQEFDGAGLHMLRELVLTYATAAGMREDRAVEVMLAVHELAANAVRHGAGERSAARICWCTSLSWAPGSAPTSSARILRAS